ncbi:MAG: 2Fe-2S iron-sulfur cluster-binding protein [Sandaracinaceae bacterium]
MVDKHLPVGAIDVTASALARVTPRTLRPRIEQARHDLLALVGRRAIMARTPGQSARARKPLSEIDPVEHLMPTSGMRRRYITWRTDLTWLARDLRGGRRSPVIEGRTSRYRSAPTSSTRDALRPRMVRVVNRIEETPDAVTLELSALEGEFTFEAGQFLTFHVAVEGETLRRAYSLCRAPGEGVVAVTVKRIPGGRVSGWMHANAHVGAQLEVLGPSGTFLLPEEEHELVLLAGGSGITPIRALARAALDRGWRVHLLYGSRSPRDVIFASELRTWDDAEFVLTEALEEAPPSFSGIRGRLGAEAVSGWLERLPPPRAPRLAYLCGPTPMRDAAAAALRESGFAESAIREERFQSPGQRPPNGPAVDRTITLRVAGQDRQVDVPAGQTLLEAGLEAGAALPFSCAMGGCAACKVTLVRGQVEMDEPNCLTPEERAAGAVLTCCARAASDDVVLEVPS